uniref:Uncharacterized protein n=1 Tax=Anguilla anguilla TaxID=7936 RepID=A0A0E9WII0_ANGAN
MYCVSSFYFTALWWSFCSFCMRFTVTLIYCAVLAFLSLLNFIHS